MAGPDTQVFEDTSFEEQVLRSEKPVLVDFWAEWCAPCKALAPTIDAVATAYKDRAVVGKMDTDGNPQTAAQFGISAIPTVILFKNGEIAEKFVGLRGEQDFKDALDRCLG